MSDAAMHAVVDRYLAGALSAPLALMHLLIAKPEPAAVEAFVAGAALAASSADRHRAEALRNLLADCRARITTIAELLRTGIDHATAADSIADGLESCRALFDRLARVDPEAAAALYSLGSPELLAGFTGEIVAMLTGWGLVGRDRRVLDLGCGFGRIAAALAPSVASVIGIDLSAEMIAQAKARHRRQANLRFVLGAGADLAGIPDASVDLVLAVDSFPYMVQCSPELAARHVAEAARVLDAPGDLVIFNFSYRDLASDRAAVAALAERHGFALERNGEHCFTLWDAAAFHLRRRPRDARDDPRRPSRAEP